MDEAALARFVEWQIAEGTEGVVPVGTTGESPTLNHAEHQRVVEIAVEAAAGRVPVIAGAGSNSTAEAIELTRHAKQAGAAWGHETGTAELNDEKAAVADAKDEEAKEGIVADATVVDAEGAPAQEEDNVKSYEQYLAEQLEKKAALGGSTEVRKPNEGASKKFPEGKASARSEEENFIAPSAGKAKKQKERKDKNLLDIDQA